MQSDCDPKRAPVQNGPRTSHRSTGWEEVRVRSPPNDARISVLRVGVIDQRNRCHSMSAPSSVPLENEGGRPQRRGRWRLGRLFFARPIRTLREVAGFRPPYGKFSGEIVAIAVMCPIRGLVFATRPGIVRTTGSSCQCSVLVATGAGRQSPLGKVELGMAASGRIAGDSLTRTAERDGQPKTRPRADRRWSPDETADFDSSGSPRRGEARERVGGRTA